jgi:hypothetical protein
VRSAHLTFTNHFFIRAKSIRRVRTAHLTLTKSYSYQIRTSSELFISLLSPSWKVYRRNFLLWSHQTLIYNENLSVIPDYILAKRSTLGTVVFDKPYFILVEAKKESAFEVRSLPHAS